MLSRLNDRRAAQGQQNSAARQQIRQQIRLTLAGPDGDDKRNSLKKLTDEANKLNVPKDKLKMWMGQDTKSHMIYVDGPSDIFAALEIVDTNYDVGKCIKIIGPLIVAKAYQGQFKGLWSIGSQSRTEYLGE